MSIRMTHVITCTSAGQTRARGAPARAARPSPAAPPAPAMLFYSFFKTLVGKEVTVELKNDLAVRGVLHSVDQYLNVKLEDIKVKSGIRGGGGVMPCVARGARRARQAGSARAAQRGAARAGRPSATSQCRPLSAPPPCVTLRVARVGACTDACGCMLCAARLSARPLVRPPACRLVRVSAGPLARIAGGGSQQTPASAVGAIVLHPRLGGALRVSPQGRRGHGGAARCHQERGARGVVLEHSVGGSRAWPHCPRHASLVAGAPAAQVAIAAWPNAMVVSRSVRDGRRRWA